MNKIIVSHAKVSTAIQSHSPQQGLSGHPVLVPNDRFQAVECAQEQREDTQHGTDAEATYTSAARCVRAFD